MRTYDVDYNLIDGHTLDECFTNADELRKFTMPRKNLNLSQVNELLHEIPGSLWWQFLICEYDNSVIDAYGCPELIGSINLAEWVYNEGL